MKNAFLLKTLEDALASMGEVLDVGLFPSFPWEEFSSELAKTFEQKSCKVIPHTTEETAEPLEGMGESPLIAPITLSPIPEPLFLVLPQKTKRDLTSTLLGKRLSESTLEEGFIHFTLLNVFETFNRLNPFHNLFVSFADESPLPRKVITVDVSITFEGKTLWARLIISPEAKESFQNFFQGEKPSLLDNPKLKNLPLNLTVEVGKTQVSPREWKGVKVGDFLLLDRCTFNPAGGKGTATLSLNATPLFDLRMKDGECKILEYAFVSEGHPHAPQIEAEEGSEERPLWASENGDKNVPQRGLTLHAEIATLQMPLEKITHLKAGDLLEIGTGSFPTVFLSTKGKRVAKGELVAIGDAMGVKLLKLGV